MSLTTEDSSPYPVAVQDSGPPPAASPRVRITPWRLLNTAVLLILGTTKAVSTLLGQTSAPNNLDWTIGVVWALISYWVSIVEQEAPTVAPWFFTADLSRIVCVGFTGLFTVMGVAIYWSVIYGLMAFTFGRSSYSTVHHGAWVGIVGFIVLIVLLFAALRLPLIIGPLRRSFSKFRFPRLPNGVFHRSDWVPHFSELLIFHGVLWLSPAGMTFILWSLPWKDGESDSDIGSILTLGAILALMMIWGFVASLLTSVAGQMVSRWMKGLTTFLTSRLRPFLTNRLRTGGDSSARASALPMANVPS
ncbi:hypothetical protein B0H17DRAFT_1125542 [Mycena rosella]|uniref:Uncharacterized protein n=1 Tax=Mycena rosella TaxID=1033263 RepID=A0AAD7M9L3_MYCRO|nr:hypothetical protein B0H17DRAFT_1125542 [Mycena rosella]